MQERLHAARSKPLLRAILPMNRWLSLITLVAAMPLATAQTAKTAKMSPPDQPLQRTANRERNGTAAFVRVADVPLVVTGQIFPDSAAGDASTQAVAALRKLESVLSSAGGDVSRLARLNAFVADDRAVSAVEAAVAGRFRDLPVAFTVVRTPLAVPGAQVAFEAVGISSRPASAVEMLSRDAAILPAGGKVFISGQAERGSDMAAAVRATMAGLHRSVAHLGLRKADIVQVKAFIQPFAEHAVAVREIAASFDGGTVPPMVVYEWVSELFTEIEVVVSAKSLPASDGERFAFDFLGWMS
jgi:enamine deaminase RidA (YjgF/YER057c/UK114 family)